MRKHIVLLLFILCLFTITGCNSPAKKGKQIELFTFENQDQREFGLRDLKGTIWIANFIFTSCETVCPPMMHEMATLQEKLTEENIQVEFVSFTVDPQIDTPAVLKEYIQHFTDNEENWNVLTGYSQQDIEEFSLEQFQTIVQKPETSNQVIHGTNFYLVDSEGYLIEEYNYTDDSYIEDIIKDIIKIQ